MPGGVAVASLITTLGLKSQADLGLILPHEHVFVDLRTPDQPGQGQAEAAKVVALMAPQIVQAQAAGVTAIVECSPVGVGRRADILKAVSEATGLPLVVPTGIYREPWIPRWAQEAGEDELRAWMVAELSGDIEGTGVQAGFIKLSAGDDGLTACETKILRAAVRAAASVGAAIASHTVRGSVVRDQLDIIERCGYTAERFVWVHASAEPDIALNLEIARRGAWIEYDWIGGEPESVSLGRVLSMLDVGLVGRILLSQDRGFYDPAQPGGGIPRPYTYLSDVFIPVLRAAGVNEGAIYQMTCVNPFRAFAR
jgi:phosphotriesterase-related protein